MLSKIFNLIIVITLILYIVFKLFFPTYGDFKIQTKDNIERNNIIQDYLEIRE